MLNPRYDLDDFQRIINEGFEYKLPLDTINIISTLSEKVGAPSYVKTPVFEKKENHKRRKNGICVTNSEWDTIREFKVTDIKKKEGIDKIIDEIRSILNKMSAENFETKSKELYIIINSILDNEEFNENINENIKKVAKALFDIVSSNKFYSELYAKLYNELMNKYETFTNIFNDNFNQFLELFDNIIYVDPNEDYDAYCKNNKINEQRKSLSLFFVNLMKHNVISEYEIILVIEKLQLRLEFYMNEATSVNKAEEVTENLFIIVTNTKEELKKSSSYVDIYNKIKTIAEYEGKEKPSISNKIIFKHMDIFDVLE